MKRFLNFCAVFFFALTITASNLVSPKHKNIRYIGRVSLANPDCARFTFPGTQIRTVFQGTSVKMLMKPNSGFFMVELDNKLPYKVKSPEKDSVMVVASNLKSGNHNLTITMCTEGNNKKPEFWGFILDDGCTLPAAPQLPQRKMEFIGNSITCGYGVEGKSGAEKFSFATENAYYSFASRTARHFNAQCMIVARSGMGVYRNCGGKVTGDKIVMPVIYPYTLFNDTTEAWNFKSYIPDVVCINMGTNDSSSSKYNHEMFVDAYTRFIKTIRANYPSAPIVILSGTMIKAGTDRDNILRDLLNQVHHNIYSSGDHNIYRLDLTPEDNTMGWGADYHPSMKRQQRMTDELTAFLSKILGW